MTRSGSRECQRAEWEALRSGYELILLDLGCGDGSHVRRFAIEHPDWLVLGLDTDRDALRGAAQRCARRPERGGRPTRCSSPPMQRNRRLSWTAWRPG